MVKDAWNNFKLEFSNDKNEQQLVSNFEENYIFGKMKMGYQNKRTPKRHEPIFLPKCSLFLQGHLPEFQEHQTLRTIGFLHHPWYE